MRHHGNLGKESQVHSGHEAPAKAAGVGDEKRADVRGTQGGGSTAEAAGLRGAVKHLESQHAAVHHKVRK